MSGDSDDSFNFLSINLAEASGSDIAVSVMLILIFTAFCFFFSLCEGAVSFSGSSKLKHFADTDKKGSMRALKLKNDSAKYNLYAKTGFVLNAAAAAVYSEFVYCPIIAGSLERYISNGYTVTIISAVLVFVGVIFLISVFGQIIPSRIASENAEKKLISVSGAFVILSAVITPAAALFSLISDIILRIFGHNTSKNANDLTEEKILMLVDEGEENGVIEEDTKDMIENVFDFDDTEVGQIMTHRKEVVAVRDDAKITDVVQAAVKSGRSRLPVYHDDIDEIVGIVHVKDLLRYVSKGAHDECINKDIINEAVFVPESKRCSEMFKYMTENKTQIAVVVDEFGGTGGIITMEDLIESIVGSIQDEYDNEDEDIRRINDYSFTVDGATPLDEISDLTGIDFAGDDNDTLAGIMLDRMGHIPKNGEHPSVVIDGTRFTVQEVENRRISKVLIVKKQEVPIL